MPGSANRGRWGVQTGPPSTHSPQNTPLPRLPPQLKCHPLSFNQKDSPPLRSSPSMVHQTSSVPSWPLTRSFPYLNHCPSNCLLLLGPRGQCPETFRTPCYYLPPHLAL